MAHDLLEAQCFEKTVYGAHCEALDPGAVASAGARRDGCKQAGNRLSKVIR